MRYAAFLSYSHADARWAQWLHRRLEAYRVPKRLVGQPGPKGPIPARLGTVFRDRDELPTAGDLGATIRAALADSAALVVVCSPEAARSRWVNAEIDAFQALGRGDHVAAFVVSGDPGGNGSADCFPQALTAAGDDGIAREPLAADARRQGDGRERAFLKLVAGLLGVSYDALAQREAQRRHRRMFAITTAAVIGMAIALGLAATAYVARNDAQRRQAQAEDILGFMLGDLRGKLTTVGRLDLMRAVDDKATAYFATLNPRDLSDRALEEQARSLTGIGQVRLGEGNHVAASAAFREALSRSTALYEREPGNGQRLFDLAQAQYWIGLVAYKQGRIADAGDWMRKYRDSAIRLAAMDRGNFDWQKEVAYGYQNLAIIENSRGHYAGAEHEMRAQLALYRKWIAERPGDLQLRFEAANATSWLATLSLQQGRLAEAERHFAEQVATMRRNVVDDPGNAIWKGNLVDATLLLVDVQAQRGRLDAARASVASITPLAEALHAQDPANNDWRIALGNCLWWRSMLDAGDAPQRAAEDAARAATLLAAAHAAEPKSERALSLLARATLQLARSAFDAGDEATARRQLATTLALVEPAWRDGHSETLRLWLARARLLQGEIARRDGRGDDAIAAWDEARGLLMDDAGSGVAFARLDPLVRALRLLGRASEAARYRQRLDAAGYVPLHPWPPQAAAIASRTVR